MFEVEPQFTISFECHINGLLLSEQQLADKWVSLMAHLYPVIIIHWAFEKSSNTYRNSNFYWHQTKCFIQKVKLCS
jgi:hypothetical protein